MAAVPSHVATKRRTKIAVVIGTLEVGGAELDIVRNIPRLNRDEFGVVVVTFGPAGTLAPELERQGIRVVARGVPSLTATGSPVARLVRRVAYTLGVVPWIGRTLNAEKVDIAHFFLPHSYGYGMLACLLMRPKAKRVMSRLSLNFYKGGHKILSWLEHSLFHPKVDIAIGNSKLILEELVEEGVNPSKVRLLHNGIDPAPFARREGARESAREALKVEQEAFVIVAVGNLHTYKGHADLIEACALASDHLPKPWHLFIAGRDEEGNRAIYEGLIERRGLADQVALLGEYKDVPQLLAAADLFVQPSLHEGFPNAVIEAMAAQLPVIGTAVGGIPEAVRVVGHLSEDGSTGAEDETGWLVPPRDPAALAEALLGAAGDPDRRARMGERARQRVVVEFSLERSVKGYEEIYRELAH